MYYTKCLKKFKNSSIYFIKKENFLIKHNTINFFIVEKYEILKFKLNIYLPQVLLFVLRVTD